MPIAMNISSFWLPKNVGIIRASALGSSCGAGVSSGIGVPLKLANQRLVALGVQQRCLWV